MIAVSDKISCQEITSPINLEIICIKLLLPNAITICVTYVPPNSTVAYYNDLFNFFLNLHTASDKLRDFNFPDIDWDLPSGSFPVSDQFCDLIFQTGLSQLIDMPTHVHGNILDLLLTNVDDNICQLQIHSDQSLCHQIISASHFQCLSAVHPPSQLLISHLITLKVIIKVCVTICFTPTLPLAIQVMTLSIYGTL